MIFIDSVFGALSTMFKITLVIIPIMIVMEIARDLNIIDKIAKGMHPITKHFKIADEGTILVTIGLLFGLTYGAGVIIQSSKEGHLDQRSLIIVAIFLATCHAVFEDAILFVAMGANGVLLISIRFITAVILTYIVSRKLKIEV